jgi:hypothetical protein
MDPVDHYAKLKSDIRALEDQANALRASFLRPGARLRSNQFEVAVRKQRRRVFQKDLLPPQVLNDPRYWSETESVVVTLNALGSVDKPLKTNDDPVLIERF